MKRARADDHGISKSPDDDDHDDAPPRQHHEDSGGSSFFVEVPTASQATSLIDAVRLAVPGPPPVETPTKNGGDVDPGLSSAGRDLHVVPAAPPSVLMPWMGFGTYKLAKDRVESVVLQALHCGYRALDTAFVYGGETTELSVGKAIQTALQQQILDHRSSLFVITKHWRKYHGYEPTLQCLDLSLHRLQLDYIDLWLMHWPGPAWGAAEPRNRDDNNKDVATSKASVDRTNDTDHRWNGATHAAVDMADVRAETWRAMEDAVRSGKCRAIGVSNFSVDHLKTLKKTATLWPPAVNQIELHPLRPQTELVEYCQNEGIVVQAYASLGGQDMGKAAWKQLLGGTNFVKASSSHRTGQGSSVSLLHSKPVATLAQSLGVTPAQVLLRWGLEQNCALVPKASSQEHLVENAQALTNPRTRLSKEQVTRLQADLLELVASGHPDPIEREGLTRLCWRNDPLRMLDFE